MGCFFTDDEMASLETADNNPLADKLRDAREVFIFGTGYTGTHLAETWREFPESFALTGFISDDPALRGGELLGLPVYAPGDVAERGGGTHVIIAQTHTIGTIRALDECVRFGFSYSLFNDTMPFVIAPKTARKQIAYFEENAAPLGKDGFWADQESLDVYKSLIRLRVFGTPPIMDKDGNDYYFDPCVPRTAFRNFVDVGGFTGDTFLNFIYRFGEDYESYLALEAAGQNFDVLRKTLEGFPKAECRRLAAWNEKTTLRFANDMSGASFVAEEKDGTDIMLDRYLASVAKLVCEVEADSLDNTLAGREVSCIKMDIEGSEMDALRGSVGIIAKNRPVLSICIYHSPEHLWSIPLWIKRLGAGYRLYCRHYWHTVSETTCYAIPN